MASTKRSLEFDDLSTASSPCKSAKVQGVVLQLSPMKGKYFDGRLADDNASIRIVGFDSRKQQELSKIYEKQQPVILENCQLTKSKFTEEMEVVLTSGTKVTSSGKKFNVCSLTNATSTDISLDALETFQNYQVVCVTVRVTRKAEPVEIKPGLIKQDYARCMAR